LLAFRLTGGAKGGILELFWLHKSCPNLLIFRLRSCWLRLGPNCHFGIFAS
jgi:hypothetical protein